MNGDFFNRIGVADMEKVHSAVIGWMFSDDCLALTPQQKTELLCGLFGENHQTFNSIRVEVEHHDIDILIITDEQTNPECWVIENKIKSSQHSGQLDKYVDIVQGNPVKRGRTTHRIKDYMNMKQHFCFLTLVNEKAQCNPWTNNTYKNFAGLIGDVFHFKSNADAVILNEYKLCIEKLADALDDFLKDHKKYPNVFIDGGNKKNITSKTQAPGQYAKFIAENGFETIFQKCFLSHVKGLTNNFKDFNISETHGVALAAKDLREVNKTKLGIQFQNGAFKVQVVEPNCNSMVNFWKNKWNAIFLKLTTTNGWKKNESKEQKKPYFSYSQQVRIKGPWYSNDLKVIVQEWDRMYGECQIVLQELAKFC